MCPPSFLALLAAAIFFSQAITSQEDNRYEACRRPLRCGGVEVSYPFLMNNRPSYCGQPNFMLTCEDDKPEIVVDSMRYEVKNITYSDRAVTLVDKAVLEMGGCPNSSSYQRITNPMLEFTTGDGPLIVLMTGCSQSPQSPNESYNYSPVPSNFSTMGFNEMCPGVGNDASYSYWAYDDPRYSQFYTVAGARELGCSNLVKVGVPAMALNQLSRNSSAIRDVMKEGVELRWVVGQEWCPGCTNSSGVCGFNQSYPGEPTCFCSDGSVSPSCSTSISPTAPPGNSRGTKRGTMRGTVIGVVVGGIGAMAAIFAVITICYRRRKRLVKASSVLLARNITPDSSSNYDLEKSIGKSMNYPTHVFAYQELEEATNNFDSSKELGDGGFGTVYYGKLKDGRSVAVKRLYENNLRRVEQFLNEVQILSTLRHQNLVTLYGCTSRHSRELLLVYEFIPNGTVADHLHGSRAQRGGLTWPVRLAIAVETAEALAYLHAIDPPIIHRDVKTNNILLDNNYRVKVADFGLSRLFPLDVTHISTSPQGTPGYLDPDYYKCYQLTDKSDVYSFGVVLAELISSKPAVDITRHRHDINLANMAMSKIRSGALDEFVDLSLGYNSDSKVKEGMTYMAEVAFRCLGEEKDDRPSMDEVVTELKRIELGELHGHGVGSTEEGGDHNPREDVGLLKNIPPPSPDSVMDPWRSNLTTPNTST